ncbi:hypothetical protein [Nostoc sp. 106C]|nr:hypothetical protein [Nostoc sp. 106C]
MKKLAIDNSNTSKLCQGFPISGELLIFFRADLAQISDRLI